MTLSIYYNLISNLLSSVLTELNEIVFVYDGDKGVCKLYMNRKYGMQFPMLPSNAMFFNKLTVSPGIRIN